MINDVLVLLNIWMNVVSMVVDRCGRMNESMSKRMNERLNVSGVSRGHIIGESVVCLQQITFLFIHNIYIYIYTYQPFNPLNNNMNKLTLA